MIRRSFLVLSSLLAAVGVVGAPRPAHSSEPPLPRMPEFEAGLRRLAERWRLEGSDPVVKRTPNGVLVDGVADLRGKVSQICVASLRDPPARLFRIVLLDLAFDASGWRPKVREEYRMVRRAADAAAYVMNGLDAPPFVDRAKLGRLLAEAFELGGPSDVGATRRLFEERGVFPPDYLARAYARPRYPDDPAKTAEMDTARARLAGREVASRRVEAGLLPDTERARETFSRVFADALVWRAASPG